jgi:hypothetical protein
MLQIDILYYIIILYYIASYILMIDNDNLKHVNDKAIVMFIVEPSNIAKTLLQIFGDLTEDQNRHLRLQDGSTINLLDSSTHSCWA